jgi:hypothetical protein
MFCKRDSDGVDWYIHARDATAWVAGSVKLTANTQNGNLVTQAVSYDQSGLFPNNCCLFEVLGYTGTTPYADLGRCILDVDAKTFTPIVLPPPSPILDKADIWRRATDAEAETIVQALGQQSVRKQRLFNDAQYIDLTDPDFADLQQGFVAAFGADRAAQLLAPSNADAIAAASATTRPASS